jgi:transcriptional regulator with XRE-family HTH domain
LRHQFGFKVRRSREEKGLSQEGFAEVLCLHRTYIGAIERGERNVSIDNIAKIADALRVPIAELLPVVRPKEMRGA